MSLNLLEQIDAIRNFVRKSRNCSEEQKEDLADGVEKRLILLMQNVVAGPCLSAYSLPYSENVVKMNTEDHDAVKMLINEEI